MSSNQEMCPYTNNMKGETMLKKIMNKKGITLIELVLSMALLAVMLLPLSSVFTNSLVKNREINDMVVAKQIAQKIVEDSKDYGSEVLISKFPSLKSDVDAWDGSTPFSSLSLDIPKTMDDSAYENTIPVPDSFPDGTGVSGFTASVEIKGYDNLNRYDGPGTLVEDIRLELKDDAPTIRYVSNASSAIDEFNYASNFSVADNISIKVSADAAIVFEHENTDPSDDIIDGLYSFDTHFDHLSSPNYGAVPDDQKNIAVKVLCKGRKPVNLHVYNNLGNNTIPVNIYKVYDGGSNTVKVITHSGKVVSHNNLYSSNTEGSMPNMFTMTVSVFKNGKELLKISDLIK